MSNLLNQLVGGVTKQLVKRATLASLVGGFAAAMANPSPAAAAEVAYYTYTRVGSAGSYFQVLTSSATTHCSLTGVRSEDTDTAGEYTKCRVYPQNGVYVLETTLGANGDAKVTCEARCWTN
jgi:hypothetical protein